MQLPINLTLDKIVERYLYKFVAEDHLIEEVVATTLTEALEKAGNIYDIVQTFHFAALLVNPKQLHRIVFWTPIPNL